MFKKLSKNLSKLFSKKNVLPLLAGIVLICLLCNMSYQGGLVEGFVEGMKEGGEQKGEEQKGEEQKGKEQKGKEDKDACLKKYSRIIKSCNGCRNKVSSFSKERKGWNWLQSLQDKLRNDKKPCGDVCDEARKHLKANGGPCEETLAPMVRPGGGPQPEPKKPEPKKLDADSFSNFF
jgi:hypothetical protein